MNYKIEPTKNTERFSHTAEYYARYRPSYPQALIDFLIEKHVINKDSHIADIGSGTGVFTQLLLDTGATVFAVEPNQAMRNVAENHLNRFPNYNSINATAENTTLENTSIDAISVATAFHWFDYQACRNEFKRILKPNGWVMLIWNLRLPNLSALLQGYDDILVKHCPQYNGIPSQKTSEQKLVSFFSNDTVEIIEFDNQQQFDLNGLIGRLRSTSYALTPEQAGYEAMINDVEKLFHQNAVNNKVTMQYTTKLYLGKLDHTENSSF